MKELDNEKFQIDLIHQNKISKTKFFKKLDSLVNGVSSLMDNNKNIYMKNNNLSLSSNNKLENNLKECIKYNMYLQNKNNNEINSLNDNIIKEYNKVTGISISRTEDLNLKINFNFLGEKNEYYIILSFQKDKFSVVDISPKDVNYKKYNAQHNKAEDISLFLCKLINYELIPHYESKKYK